MSTHRKVYLEITNRCNLHCAFCPGTKRKPKWINETEFAILVNKVAPWAEYLYYHLMGEPTAHPSLLRFMEIASSFGLKSIITTNGTLLADNGDGLIGAKPYKVNISLHSFEANADGICFEAYIDSCLSFAKRAAENGIIVVLRLWNLDGRADGALNEKNEQILDMMHQSFASEWQNTRSGYKMCERVFLEWGEKFDWPNLDMDILSDEGFCYGLRDQIGVLSDGSVVPCCLDSDGDITLGNLFEQSLAEILDSPRARAI